MNFKFIQKNLFTTSVTTSGTRVNLKSQNSNYIKTQTKMTATTPLFETNIEEHSPCPYHLSS